MEDNSGPTELQVTPRRIEQLGLLLRNREASARVVNETLDGSLSESQPGDIVIDGVHIAVSDEAVIRVTADKGGGPGIEISSDTRPEPPGTWIRIRTLAVQEAHEVMRQLASGEDAASPNP